MFMSLNITKNEYRNTSQAMGKSDLGKPNFAKSFRYLHNYIWKSRKINGIQASSLA